MQRGHTHADNTVVRHIKLFQLSNSERLIIAQPGRRVENVIIIKLYDCLTLPLHCTYCPKSHIRQNPATQIYYYHGGPKVQIRTLRFEYTILYIFKLSYIRSRDPEGVSYLVAVQDSYLSCLSMNLCVEYVGSTSTV